MIFGAYHQPGLDPRIALEESIELFPFAEDLGYGLANHGVRHFERALTGVYPFPGTVARETRRIRLGTGTVPIANESPARLAEDTVTAGLLSGGRSESTRASRISGGGSGMARDQPPARSGQVSYASVASCRISPVTKPALICSRGKPARTKSWKSTPTSTRGLEGRVQSVGPHGAESQSAAPADTTKRHCR
ncbi:LLM class flavin-dependent oxidoreductase [Frankia tisae]|uniref:LLM class flavin-dependent oxidoreductase n=1 Tax=Frankia tisae TaxID=2950104 RepID=UPI0021BEBFBA|nr:LLM class flavin-dependent oxidoreductase [Frankia tisae]